MAKSISTSTTTDPKDKMFLIKEHPKRIVLLVVVILLVITGGLICFVQARRVVAINSEPALQTATVRQGSLVISASGSGTLVASDERELAFSTSGQVRSVYVKPGDQVEASTLLAQVDDTQARIEYEQAKQNYLELTSEAAIASAQQQVAQAQAELMSTKYDLEYLISPDVLYWETEIANSKQTIEDANSRLEAAPADTEAQKNLAKAETYLSFAQDMLHDAWDRYYEEYVPDTFRLVEDRNDKDIYAIPTELEIRVARTSIDEAQKKLDDCQELYDVLTGSPMPKITSNDALVAIQDAERDLQDAQAVLEGTSIVAPITGTVLSVDMSVGTTVNTSTVLTMADLNQLELDFYLDETDWGLAAVGDQVEVAFPAIPDQVFTGQVTQLDTELYQSGNTTAVKGIAQLDNASVGTSLPVGTSASIDIIHARADNAILIPVEALHETTSGEYTVTLIENGTHTQRMVKIGLQDQFYAEVKSGLSAGDVVSTESTSTN